MITQHRAQADTAQLRHTSYCYTVKRTHSHFRMAAPRLGLAVFVLMLAVIALSEGMRSTGPRKCCSSFNEKPVRKERVVSYIKTSQRCPIPGIFLKTVVGRQLCVRPSATWVKEIVAYLDAKTVPGETSNL
uniref:chemokine (C-C motif) ligand 35, duplicate 1 n=1 Tax=Scatophagus argus TaxID=75038 RepID=UPI001ED82FA4|nr:chemokine (C-C motif) ligand 35, duplicate 1 [Scatophagus argus]